MSKQWLGVCVILCAAGTAQAQQYYNPYYYGNSYYNQPAPRYYYPPAYNPYANNPYANSGYYRPAPTYYAAPQAPSYYAAPPQAYPAQAPNIYLPLNTPMRSGPIYSAAQSTAAPETVIEVQPQGPRIIRQADPLGEFQAPAPRPVETVQVEEPPLPGRSAPDDNERGNVAIFWDKLMSALSPLDPSVFERRRPDCMWVSADYVAAYLRPMQLAGPLVSTGSFNDNFPGSIGQPSTTVLFGSDAINFNLASGVRLSLGVYLDSAGHYSIDAGGFGIFPTTQSTTFSSDGQGNPLLARPVSATDQNQGAFAIAAPGLVSGSTKLDFSSQLSGAELNGRYHGLFGALGRYDLLMGVRYARLAERMGIHDDTTGINGNTVLFNGQPAFSASRDDSFATTNQFFGMQLGSQVSWDHRWVNLNAFAKLGLGGTLQQVNIDGSSTALTPTGSQSGAGGILALPSNIGNHTRTVFGVLPELGLNVGLNLTDHVRVRLGYSVLFWNSVVRPGQQYPTTITDSQAPTGVNFGNNPVGPIAPQFRFADEHFFVQSLNLGVEFHY